MREEFKELLKELAGISAVDEFARYARTQRKMNKIEEQIQSLGQSRMDDRESIKWKFTKTIQVINVTLYMFSNVIELSSQPLRSLDRVPFSSTWLSLNDTNRFLLDCLTGSGR